MWNQRLRGESPRARGVGRSAGTAEMEQNESPAGRVLCLVQQLVASPLALRWHAGRWDLERTQGQSVGKT